MCFSSYKLLSNLHRKPVWDFDTSRLVSDLIRAPGKSITRKISNTTILYDHIWQASLQEKMAAVYFQKRVAHRLKTSLCVSVCHCHWRLWKGAYLVLLTEYYAAYYYMYITNTTVNDEEFLGLHNILQIYLIAKNDLYPKSTIFFHFIHFYLLFSNCGAIQMIKSWFTPDSFLHLLPG